MIFAVGFVLRVLVILIGHTYRVSVDQGHFKFGFEMGRIARSLVQGQGYANPFNGVSGPTAWTPPLYPLLLALSFKLFGVYTNAAALFVLVVNSLFSAGVAPAVYEIAERCFDARGLARRKGVFLGRETAAPVALWSAWLWAVYPAALQYAVHWIWEMSVSTFLFSWVIVVALRLRGVGRAAEDREKAQTSLVWWAVFGLLWGVLNLSNVSLLLCLPGMLVWIAWPALRAKEWLWVGRCVGGAAVACLAVCVVMMPWWVRNERALHAFVPTRANLGFELYQSTRETNDGYNWGTTLPMWPGDPEFKRYVREGELKMGREQEAAAKAAMRARPMENLRWTVQRFFFFWDGPPHPFERHPEQEYGRQLSYAFLSACGLLGLALMLWRRVEGAGLFALVFLLMPVPYYLVTVQARFRHPIEPLIAVLAVWLFRSAEPRGARGHARLKG